MSIEQKLYEHYVKAVRNNYHRSTRISYLYNIDAVLASIQRAYNNRQTFAWLFEDNRKLQQQYDAEVRCILSDTSAVERLTSSWKFIREWKNSSQNNDI